MSAERYSVGLNRISEKTVEMVRAESYNVIIIIKVAYLGIDIRNEGKKTQYKPPSVSKDRIVLGNHFLQAFYHSFIRGFAFRKFFTNAFVNFI